MNIVKLAFGMSAAVERFLIKAKRFYYHVMLVGCRCPRCKGSLIMIAEGRCRCNICRNEFDPTVAFQRCVICGGTAILRIRRYQCKECGNEVASRFLFHGLVFNAEYFRAKMIEFRQKKKEQQERVRKMLAECRSDTLSLKAIELAAVPGLLEALNGLSAGIDESYEIESQDEFNLNRYEEHIQAHIQDVPVTLDEIPPLSKENPRRDLIWRFIALIFLDHTGVINIWEEGQDIMVVKNEVNRKRQGLFGESEDTDGIEGSVGKVEA